MLLGSPHNKEHISNHLILIMCFGPRRSGLAKEEKNHLRNHLPYLYKYRLFDLNIHKKKHDIHMAQACYAMHAMTKKTSPRLMRYHFTNPRRGPSQRRWGGWKPTPGRHMWRAKVECPTAKGENKNQRRRNKTKKAKEKGGREAPQPTSLWPCPTVRHVTPRGARSGQASRTAGGRAGRAGEAGRERGSASSILRTRAWRLRPTLSCRSVSRRQDRVDLRHRDGSVDVRNPIVDPQEGA